MMRLWLAAACLATLIGTCENVKDPVIPDPGVLPSQFVFTVDGARRTAIGAAYADTGFVTLTLLAATQIGGEYVTISIVFANTTPPLQTPVALGDIDSGGVAVGSLAYGTQDSITALYLTDGRGATGTVTLKERTSSLVSGTCSFIARRPGGGAQKQVTDGAFNLPFATQGGGVRMSSGLR